MDYLEWFYRRIAELRAQKGVSARDMSLSLGQSESYVNKIENKHTLPSMAGFFYICEYFGITPDKFFNTDSASPFQSASLLAEFEKLRSDHAEQNNDLLTKLITMDEGSAYLGECALVPYDSPIRQSGLLFYNTLFDENAACHLALGMGFADTINDFESKTLEECRALGVNDSMVHEDFMIGSADMSIDAVCEDGRTVPVFRNGSWAF